MELFKSQFEQWEDEFIINNYKNFTYKQICEQLNGDGCISKSKNAYSITFANANLKFLQYLQQRLQKFGFYSSIFTEDQRNFDLYIKGNKIEFLDLLYKNANVYLERKYKIYQDAVCFRNETND